jgi:ABC-2 type transport system ATP-binding protein
MDGEFIQSLRDAGWQEHAIRDYLAKQVPQGPDTLLTADKVAFSYGEQPLLDNISFYVYRGEIFGLIGLSGAGKTTLLNVLAGIAKPSTGSVHIAPGTRVGFSTQSHSFYEELTVSENCHYFAQLEGIGNRQERITTLLAQLGLQEVADQQASKLSGGVQKKLDIALSLLSDPDLIFLDEPTADLDPISREHLWTFLRQLQKQGKTIIVATHLLEEVQPLSGRVAIIHNGTVADVGSTEHFRERLGTRYVLRFELESGNYAPFSHYQGWQVGKQRVMPIETQQDIFALLKTILDSGDALVHVNLEQPTLQNMFHRLVQ